MAGQGRIILGEGAMAPLAPPLKAILSHKLHEIQLSLGLADSFEYLLCQQMAATAQLYS